ncbi:MAG: response regulator [Elusimicrobiota bacterium]
MRFFIVEDNSYTALTVRIALEKMGHEVIGNAENSEEAIEKIMKTDFDALLLDLLLPGESGIKVLDNLNKKVKVIAMTALEQDKIDEELNKRKVDFILRKPFSYEDLEKAVKKIV